MMMQGSALRSGIQRMIGMGRALVHARSAMDGIDGADIGLLHVAPEADLRKQSRGTGFAGPQANGPLGGQGATRSEQPWGL